MSAQSDSIRVVSESDLLELARVARSTWQNWIRQEILQPAPRGHYRESDVVEVAVIALLAAAYDLRRTRLIWHGCRDVVTAACTAMPLQGDETLDFVADSHTLQAIVARNQAELSAAIRAPTPFPRPRFAIPLDGIIREAREAFWTRAVPPAELGRDRRRKANAPGQRSQPRTTP
jgi:hypothetical protein